MSQSALSKELSASLLLDPAVVADPYAFYRRLVAETPVWRIPGTDIVLVTSFAAVTEAANRVADFSSTLHGIVYRADDGTPAVMPFDTGGMDALATADPPVHSRHRGAVFPELVARRMATMRPDVEQLAENHIDACLARGHVEFMHDVANAVPIRVVTDLIGFANADPDMLLTAAFESTATMAGTQTRDEVGVRMGNSMLSLGWITDQVSASTPDTPGLLGATATAIASGDLTELEAIVIIQTLLSAGGESTTSLLGNAVAQLATDEAFQTQLREKPELVTPFVEEMLRLESPFRYHLRHATQDTELLGTPVPAGATVLLMWGAANRDPAVYEHPDEVVLDRASPRHHLGFGRGIHLCVGAPLARLEADVVLRCVLARTASFALDPSDPPERESSLMVRRFRRLPLVVSAA
ncbi:MAG TPA: cytochrome P450 [Acidimicrobiales bacterium]|nr:cytochrome P450 [Acidimicrobiales bacterium]